MATTRTEMWKNQTFTIERIEGQAPLTIIYQITGVFNARDMYGSMKQVQLGNIFEFKPESGSETPTRHIFDLTEVPQMDSSGLGVLVSHFIACRSKGIRVIIVGSSPNVKQLFKFTKVDTILPMAATVEEALRSNP
ncbi:MAG: STAS domain-containing protein [Acidobacteria bacterium]|nr:STAS domain-containing protein [Acidobacteriota bacterium]